MKIIGIAGRMGAGKDTIAQIIIDEGLAKYKASFASNVKHYARKLFNMQGKDRDLLQQLGSKMREIDEDVWINQLTAQLNWIPRLDEGATIVITDVRHKNEADWLLNRDHMIIYVDATEYTRQTRIKKRDDVASFGLQWYEWASHPSEQETDHIKIMTYALDGDKKPVVRFNCHRFDNDEQLSDEQLKEKFVKWWNETKSISST